MCLSVSLRRLLDVRYSNDSDHRVPRYVKFAQRTGHHEVHSAVFQRFPLYQFHSARPLSEFVCRSERFDRYRAAQIPALGVRSCRVNRGALFASYSTLSPIRYDQTTRRSSPFLVLQRIQQVAECKFPASLRWTPLWTPARSHVLLPKTVHMRRLETRSVSVTQIHLN